MNDASDGNRVPLLVPPDLTVLTPGSARQGESAQEVADDVAAVQRVEAVPTLLQVLCDTTGMGFAAVARVSDESWTACAVHDGINFGLMPGGQLDLHSTLCIESRNARAPIFIDHASVDPVYRDHHTPIRYSIESYVSVPIVLPSGRYFGNLCAIDPRPANVSQPKIVSMFKRFAHLISLQLESEAARDRAAAALLDERAASELREQFIAILGHDLRNPLQAFFAGCDLLVRKATDPMAVTVASRMKTNATRMSALINDVLDFARGRLGSGMGLQIKEVGQLDSALRAVVDELQDIQPERSIAARVDISGPVHCDLGRIQQVVSNLLSNALTHGRADSPVRFDAKTTADELVIEVWNDGEPIPAESISKIFLPFWRRSTSTQRDGLGLGLYICSQIIDGHRGALTISSSQQDGTCFTARIPRFI